MDEMREKIERLYAMSLEFETNANAANINPTSVLASFCQTRAIIAARDMALIVKRLHTDFENMRQIETNTMGA